MNAPKAALSYGLGADSTAILLRWLDEPATAPCDLDDLIVVTAMTGDEWAITGQLTQTHVLPRLAARHVRYAQVARAGPRQADGLTVLDDSGLPPGCISPGRTGCPTNCALRAPSRSWPGPVNALLRPRARSSTPSSPP